MQNPYGGRANPGYTTTFDLNGSRVTPAACFAGGLPASKVADSDLGEVVVLDVDATIVVAHSEKERAGPTFKGTFGFHPIGVWCDNTQRCWRRIAVRP